MRFISFYFLIVLLRSCCAVVSESPGSCQAVVRQSLGSRQAVVNHCAAYETESLGQASLYCVASKTESLVCLLST